MAERVVDRLEVVQVHEQDRDRLVIPGLSLERVVDAIPEQGAVREAGDRVVEGLVRQLFLERLALRDVPRVEDDAPHVRVVEQVHEQRLDAEPAAVTVVEAVLGQRRVGVGPTAAVHQELQDAGPVLGMDERGQLGPFELGRGVPEDPFGRWADVSHGRVRVDHHHHVGGVLHEGGEPSFALTAQEVLRQRGAVQREGSLRRQRLERITGRPGHRGRVGQDEEPSELILHEHRDRGDDLGLVREPQRPRVLGVRRRHLVGAVRLQPLTLPRRQHRQGHDARVGIDLAADRGEAAAP